MKNIELENKKSPQIISLIANIFLKNIERTFLCSLPTLAGLFFIKTPRLSIAGEWLSSCIGTFLMFVGIVLFFFCSIESFLTLVDQIKLVKKNEKIKALKMTIFSFLLFIYSISFLYIFISIVLMQLK